MSNIVNKKVLITGSSGFVGSNVFREFIDLGYEVVGVNRAKHTNSHVL